MSSIHTQSAAFWKQQANYTEETEEIIEQERN